MKIKAEILTRLKTDKAAKIRLMVYFNLIESRSINRMIDKNDPRLTQIGALAIISEETGEATENILEP